MPVYSAEAGLPWGGMLGGGHVGTVGAMYAAAPLALPVVAASVQAIRTGTGSYPSYAMMAASSRSCPSVLHPVPAAHPSTSLSVLSNGACGVFPPPPRMAIAAPPQASAYSPPSVAGTLGMLSLKDSVMVKGVCYALEQLVVNSEQVCNCYISNSHFLFFMFFCYFFVFHHFFFPFRTTLLVVVLYIIMDF